MATGTATGKITQIIGAVIDVEFPRESIPKVYEALKLADVDLTLEVQQQLGDGVVRTIAMGASEGLKRGLAVNTTGDFIRSLSVQDHGGALLGAEFKHAVLRECRHRQRRLLERPENPVGIVSDPGCVERRLMVLDPIAPRHRIDEWHLAEGRRGVAIADRIGRQFWGTVAMRERNQRR